jgi:hypothetical protein
MSKAEARIGSYPSIEGDIEALQTLMSTHHMALNNEGIWLFISTLGCWSVSIAILQLIAYFLVLFIFGERMVKRSKRPMETRSFFTLIEGIEVRVKESLPEGDIQKARLYDLSKLREKLSVVNTFRSTKVFMICWLYYAVSVACCFFILITKALPCYFAAKC